MMSSPHRSAAWVSAALVVFTAGCRDHRDLPRSPTAPSVEAAAVRAAAAREFIPLAVGNVWTYHRTFRIEVEILEGDGDPFIRTFDGTGERRIVNREEDSGREYYIEQATLAINGRPNVTTTETRYRQDHAGLYVTAAAEDAPDPVPFDLRPRVSTSPVARLAWHEHAQKLDALRRLLEPALPDGKRLTGRPGGVLPGEVLSLSYPLHARSRWINRIEPFPVCSEVEAHEVLDLPAGRFECWRVRVEHEYIDPEDRVVVWYGRCGRLGSQIHAETLAIDPETGEMARIISDETERLEGLDLIDTGACDR